MKPRGRPKLHPKKVLAWGTTGRPSEPVRLFVPPREDPRREAIRIIAEYKAECKKTGHPYRRKDAIKKAADVLNQDECSLANWVNRSKRTRDS
jgi:hypothetical protein